MPTTVEIHDLDDRVYDRLERLAATHGLDVPEYLRRELTRLGSSAASTSEWLVRIDRHVQPRPGLDTLAALDDCRGAWPGDRPRVPRELVNG